MPSRYATRLEKAIRGWLEGDDESKSMAEVIDRAGVDALYAAAERAYIALDPACGTTQRAHASDYLLAAIKTTKGD